MPSFATALVFLVAALAWPFAVPDGSDDPPSVAAASANGRIEIDGRLSETAWQEAPVASGFRQLEPDEGAPASQRTDVRVLYGETALYVGARMHDTAPGKIRATLGRRDDENQADWFYVSIDSYFDRKTAYTFAVNAAGVQLDGQREGRRLDESWDAIWYSAVSVDEGGWTAELRIPYAMLRFTEAEAQTWGIQFRRKIPRLSETDEWALVPRTERSSGLVAQYGLLTGLHGIHPRRNVQASPYTVSRLSTEEGASPGELSASTDFDAGADLKVGLSSSITLDATINPDFGQVEADPATLNLSAFETFFQERRPFFVEGIQIFEFGLGGGSELLYTRRIGGEAPIVGAAKLSGRTADGLSFGVLSAATGEDFRPDRAYATARATQEIGTYSTAGGILTGFRSPGGRRQSLAAGADWDLRFRENAYRLGGFASATHRRGDALSGDAETGFAAELEAGRIQGAWTYDAGVELFDDRFDPNDLGRLRRNNYVRLSGSLEHEVNGGRPFGPFQRADAGLYAGQSWSYREGLSQGLGFFFSSDFITRNFQEIEIDIDADYLLGGYDLYETRGLGPRRQERRLGMGLEFETDSRRAWSLNPEADLSYRAGGGLGYGLELDGRWTLGARLTLSAGVRYEREDDVTAWVSNEAFALASDGAWQIGEESAPPDRLAEDAYRSFDGAADLTALLAPVTAYDDAGRYFVPVFGARDTRSLEADFRSGITFTRGLSLELYGQLFVAQGRYGRFRLLQDPETLAPFDAFPKRRDFSLRSFLSNAVLRWEFRPGSEVFLVWSQTRQEDLAPAPFDHAAASPFDAATTDEIAGTFGIFPQNVFLVKVNYTFLR